MLDVTHVPSGKRAYHCPWMLVDSDRSMIAGREILGFPKKLGAFSFAVDGVELSAAASEDDDAAKPASETARYPFRAGATVAATVSRGGVKLLDASGTLSAPAPKSTKAFSETNAGDAPRVAFLNASDEPPDSRFVFRRTNRPRVRVQPPEARAVRVRRNARHGNERGVDGTWRVAVPEPDEDGRDRGAVRGRLAGSSPRRCW